MVEKDITIHEKKEFKNIDYSEKSLRNREFIQCKFDVCIFTKSDLRNNSFEDCIFENCNFSMTIIDDAGFRNVTFIGCKIQGVDFTRCSKFMFSFRFENCSLDYCTFYGTKLKKTNFINCSLKEVDFSNTDLSEAIFTNSDFSGAIFSNTLLEKADFRSATNFSIDPEFNKVKKAKFNAFQLEGLLHKYQLDIDENV